MIWQVLVTLPEQFLTFACFSMQTYIRCYTRYGKALRSGTYSNQRDPLENNSTLSTNVGIEIKLSRRNKLFLALYAQTGNTKQASQILIDTALPQRSRLHGELLSKFFACVLYNGILHPGSLTNWLHLHKT